jgi:membrane-associated phospholipid phosphatase
VVALSSGWMLWRQRFQQMKVFAIACLGALILNQGLKLVFVRPRPLLWKQLIKEVSYSFPSGHALGSLVLYGFLAYLLGLQFPRWSQLIYGLAAGLIGAIGLSRLYLGVHYPTDVMAGYAIGFLWLMMCIVMLKLQAGRSGETSFR